MDEGMMQEMNAKLDAICEKMGIQMNGAPDKEKYMKANNEQRDQMDEQQILGKT